MYNDVYRALNHITIVLTEAALALTNNPPDDKHHGYAEGYNDAISIAFKAIKNYTKLIETEEKQTIAAAQDNPTSPNTPSYTPSWVLPPNIITPYYRYEITNPLTPNPFDYYSTWTCADTLSPTSPTTSSTPP